MEAAFQVEAAYDQILAMNAAAAADGHFEVAYHLLMSALHCAEDARNPAWLSEVAARAREQRHVVDALSPPHRLSTVSSHAGVSIFETTARMAEAVTQRLSNERRTAQLRRR